MSFFVTETSNENSYTPLSAGVHLAVCDQVVDLGIQPSNNPQFKPKRQVYIRFNVPAEQRTWEQDGVEKTGPSVVGKFYTLSLSTKAHLRNDLESWLGRPMTGEELASFDLFSLLNKAVQLNVTHRTYQKDGQERTAANITAMMPLAAGQPEPGDSETEVIGYSREAESCVLGWDEVMSSKALEALPEWLQKKVNSALGQTRGPAELDNIPLT